MLDKPVLVPDGTPTSLGSCIFALLAAGSIEDFASKRANLCSACYASNISCRRQESAAVYKRLYALYRSVYFALGTPDAAPTALGAILPDLKRIAAEVAATS